MRQKQLSMAATTWVRSPLGSCLGDMAVHMPDRGLVFEPVTCFYCSKRVTFPFHIVPLKSFIPNFVACLVFLGMAFSFTKLISSSDTLAKREAAILNICPPAIITSAEVIIAEYGAILGQ